MSSGMMVTAGSGMPSSVAESRPRADRGEARTTPAPSSDMSCPSLDNASDGAMW